jgi:hypothetical protein
MGDEGDRLFSQQLAFSLDFWWLYLFYLGAISRGTLAVVAGGLAAWSAVCAGRLAAAVTAAAPRPAEGRLS